MKSVDENLRRARLTKNKINTELYLDQLDRVIWPKIVDLSTAIFDGLSGDDELYEESKHQEELRNLVAGIRYKAKLFPIGHFWYQSSISKLFLCRTRRCKWPDETFYLGNCLHFQGRKVAYNPCPKNQQLFDGPDNLGICDCKKSVNYTWIYSESTKQCHILHTKVQNINI